MLLKKHFADFYNFYLFFFRVVLLVSVLALLPPVVFPTNLPVVYAGFIIFETCVGLFWPSMGFMRGIYVPEAGKIILLWGGLEVSVEESFEVRRQREFAMSIHFNLGAEFFEKGFLRTRIFLITLPLQKKMR